LYLGESKDERLGGLQSIVDVTKDRIL
jgi:hypothetical protein